MHGLMRERPSLRWTLCGPKYGSDGHSLPSHLTAGLALPSDRMAVMCLPLPRLLEEISSARVVIVSLGNECGPGSVLDAHAMARPVVSGNDMVYAFSNPYGTGLRVTSRDEARNALTFLLDRPDAGDAMGTAGRDFVLREYHEDLQREDLRRLVAYLQLDDDTRRLHGFAGTSHAEQRRQDLRDKVERKLRSWQAGD
jgi:hypothetical protein